MPSLARTCGWPVAVGCVHSLVILAHSGWVHPAFRHFDLYCLRIRENRDTRVGARTAWGDGGAAEPRAGTVVSRSACAVPDPVVCALWEHTDGPSEAGPGAARVPHDPGGTCIPGRVGENVGGAGGFPHAEGSSCGPLTRGWRGPCAPVQNLAGKQSDESQDISHAELGRASRGRSGSEAESHRNF